MAGLFNTFKTDARWSISLLIFMACWLLYALTAAPGVTMHDSGELITSAHVLGIGHPPGAPSWTLLAKLFTFIPLGSIAYRVHLMSGFFAALTCSLVYIFAIMLMAPKGSRPTPGQHLCGLLAAGLLAQSPAFWMKAVQAELYTLNVFFMMGILILLLNWSRQPATAPGQNKRLLLIAGLFGVGMANYMALSFYVPVVALAVLFRYKGIIKEVKLLVGLAISGIAGLSLYLYLPLRSRMNPVIDWGNPETLFHFRIVFSRKRWGELSWSEHSGTFIEKWLNSISLHNELGLPALILIVLGLVALLKKDRFATAIVAGSFFVYGIWMMMMQALTPVLNQNLYYITWYGMEEFHIPLYVSAAPLIAVGADDLLHYCRHGLARLKLRGTPGMIVGALAVVLIISSVFVPHLKTCNLSNYTQPGMLAREVLNSCSTNSWLFAPGDDPQFAVCYTKFVEGVRTDVALMTPRTSFFREVDKTLEDGQRPSRHSFLTTAKGRIDELMDFRYNQHIPDNPAEVRMFFTKIPPISSLRPALYPNRLLFELMPEALYDSNAQRDYWQEFLARPDIQPDGQLHPDFSEAMALMLQGHGDWHYQRKEYDLTAYLYERCLAYSNPTRPDVLDRLSFTLFELGKLEESYHLCKQALTLNSTNRTAWMTMARVLIAQGRLQDAMACYQSILSFAPNDSDAAENLRTLSEKMRPQP